MSTKHIFTATFIGWPLAVGSALAGRTAFVSAGFSSAELAGWAFLGCAPLAIALMIARGQATPSVAQVLYDAEHQGEKTTPLPVTVPRA